MLVEVGFWFCLALVAYVYVGYPVVAFLLSAVIRREIRKTSVEPMVTVVVSAFNEEREIERTIDNKLAQNYPAGKLDVIVVSDGSTDRTNEIVRGVADRSGGRVRLLHQEPRQGKTQALNVALAAATGDVIVFSDANSVYAPGAIRALVRNFADPSVGYVTGQMVYTNPTESGIGDGVGTYMGYENLLRAIESTLGSIVGADGGIDAVRRELYRPMKPDQLPDFVLPLSVVEQGKRVVYEPAAVLYEPALSQARDEFRMRVRVSLRALWAIYDKRVLLNPLRYPLFAWQLFSHKVLRYGAFAPLTGLFAFSLLAVRIHPIYQWFLLAEMLVLLAVALGHRFRDLSGKASKLLAPYYFFVLNVACLLAFWKFVKGEKIVLWKPRAGT